MKALVRTSIVFLLAVASIYGQQATQNGNPLRCTKDPGQRPAAILKEPTVLGAGNTWAVISWTTNASGREQGRIYAGTDKNNLGVLDQSAEDTTTNDRMESYQEQEYAHLVRLNNLRPGTTYYFRTHCGSRSNRGPDSDSSIWQFTTTGVAAVNPGVASASARGKSTATKSAKAKPDAAPASSSSDAESASLHKSSTLEGASGGKQPR